MDINELQQLALNEVNDSDKYKKRLEIEFKEIEKAGLWEYFDNIVSSGKKFHNTRNLLCCYLWGVCPENPLEEGKDLIWNVSNALPDLDVDFQPEARNHIKKYCAETFGEKNVVSIANYNHFGIKSGIRDISRVMEVPLSEVNACTTKMGDDVNRMKSWKEAIDKYPVLREFEKNNPEVCSLVKQFNGRVRSLGMHAGGIVIASCDLTKTIPLLTRTNPKTKEKMILSSFAEGQARSDLQAVGLVKQDFLGLENLNYIATCINIMKERGKYDPSVGLFRSSLNEEDWTDEAYLNDPKCIEVANKGDLQLVFQFDSAGMRQLIRKGGVTRFEDLVAYTAIFRPGPFEHFADKYCQRKQGKEEYSLHKVLEPIIGKTYGCICIAKESKIISKNGYKNIENIKVGEMVLTEDGTYQEVLKVISNGIQEILKVRCSNGEELFCTPDHKLLTYEGWKEARNLSKNDLIKSFWISKKKKVNIGSDLDWLVGLILADGNMSSSVSILCTNRDFAYKVAQTAKNIFPSLDPRVQLRKHPHGSLCWQCHLVHKRKKSSSKNELIQYLKKIKIWGLTGKNKKFPEKISLSMIAGILEGDGNSKTHVIKLRNKNLSYKLFESLQEFRINSSYYEEIDSKYKKKLYCVTFHDYKHIIPFRIMKSFWKKDRAVVVPRQLLANKRNDYKSLSYKERRKIYSIIGNRSMKTKFVSKYISDQYLDTYDHDHWSKVLSIKKDTKKEVYDLSIENNHSYIAGGLVVHNCYQEQLMQIMNKVGLISLQNVDDIRRAMSKKKEEGFNKFKPEFTAGGMETLEWSKEKVEDLWNQMINFASYGFNKCITPDSIVETKNGYKLAGECEPGDTIKSYNTEKKELFWDEVIANHDNGTKDVYEIELSNGYKIECTLDHEFVCEDGKKRKLKNILKEKRKIISKNDISLKVHEKEVNMHSVVNTESKGKKKVIDLEMKSKFHNFMANGIAVGNSHALAYSMVSARCLYLKTYYPLEYFTAVLSHLKTGDDRVKIYVQEGIRKKLKFKPMNINKSKLGYQIIDDEIFIGFDKVKGINKEAKNVIEMQPFASFEDYLSRYGLGKKVGETLISCGAFNKFHKNIKLLLNYFEYRREIGNKQKGMNRIEFGRMYKELTDSKSCPRELSIEFSELLKEKEKKISYEKLLQLVLMNKFDFSGIDKSKILDYIRFNKAKFKHIIFSLDQFERNRKNNDKEIRNFTPMERSRLEHEYYTFYFNHPLNNVRLEGLEIGKVLYSGAGGTIEGMISKIQKRKTKSGNTFYVVTVEDRLDSVQIAIWANQIGKYRDLIHEYSFVKIDIVPSPYSTWNISKHGKMERLRTLDEKSEQEERDLTSAREYEDLIASLKEYAKNESVKQEL